MIFIIKGFRTIIFIFIVIFISVKVPEFDKHLKKAGGHIGRNVGEITITIKMKTIVRKPLIMKIDIFFLDIFSFGLPY